MKSIKIFLALVFATALFSGYAAKAPAAGKTAKPAKLLNAETASKPVNSFFTPIFLFLY